MGDPAGRNVILDWLFGAPAAGEDRQTPSAPHTPAGAREPPGGATAEDIHDVLLAVGEGDFMILSADPETCIQTAFGDGGYILAAAGVAGVGTDCAAHSTRQKQYMNCWGAPHGVSCNSVTLSSSRNLGPNSPCSCPAS